MNRVLFILGLLWASPITLLAFLLYVGPCWLMGWYTLIGWNQLAWVWETNDAKAPAWLKKKWTRWAGATMGSMIVMKPYPDGSSYSRIILTHEMTHVRQVMILGVMQPFCYAVNWICGTVLKKAIGHVDGYYDNPLEIQSRRIAGQVVDIVGLTNKLQKSKSVSK